MQEDKKSHISNRKRCPKKERDASGPEGPEFFVRLSHVGDEDRAPRRTHIFLGFVGVSALDSTLHTYVRACGSSEGSDSDWDVLHSCAPS